MGNKVNLQQLVPQPTNCNRENEDREQGGWRYSLFPKYRNKFGINIDGEQVSIYKYTKNTPISTLFELLPEVSISRFRFGDACRILLNKPGEELGTIDFVGKHLLAALLEDGSALDGIHGNQ